MAEGQAEAQYDKRSLRERALWCCGCALVGLVCVGLAAWGIGPLLWPLLTDSPRPVDLPTVTKLTGLAFPPSARLVSSSYSGVVRAHIEAEVRIDGDEVEEFLEAQRSAIEHWESNWTDAPRDAPAEPDDRALPLRFAVDPPRQHPKPPYMDLKVVDVEVSIRDDGVAVVSLGGDGD